MTQSPLTPTEPEADEATKVCHEVMRRLAYVFGDDNIKREERAISHLREVLAAKDAEIAKLTSSRDHAREEHKQANRAWEMLRQDERARAEKAESELATLRAENERLLAELEISQAGKDYWQRKSTDKGIIFRGLKAAERNLAEPHGPGPWPGDPDHRETMPVDPAPVVEVTQADRDAAKTLLDQQELRYHKDGTFRDWDNTVQFLTNIRTEAEARGRREALEPLIDELKRQLQKKSAIRPAASPPGRRSS